MLWDLDKSNTPLSLERKVQRIRRHNGPVLRALRARTHYTWSDNKVRELIAV